jgi:hypothetical protein
MRSLIIIEVEHGETTDALSEYLDIIPGTNEAYPHEQEGLTVNGYTVKVDLPACFVLD